MNVNFLLIAVVALFTYLIIRGYRRGFLRIAVSLFGMILIIAAVKRISPYVSDYMINNTTAYQTIQDKITSKFAEANEKYDNTIPENQTLTINSYDVPDILKENLLINNTKEMYTKLLVDLFEEYVSAYLAKTAINAASFIIIFIALLIAFKILLTVVDLISRIPIIKGFNKFAGGCVGLIESLIIVWVFFFAIVIFIGDETSASLFAMIQQSKLLTFLFNNNALMSLIS